MDEDSSSDNSSPFLNPHCLYRQSIGHINIGIFHLEQTVVEFYGQIPLFSMTRDQFINCQGRIPEIVAEVKKRIVCYEKGTGEAGKQ